MASQRRVDIVHDALPAGKITNFIFYHKTSLTPVHLVSGEVQRFSCELVTMQSREITLKRPFSEIFFSQSSRDLVYIE